MQSKFILFILSAVLLITSCQVEEVIINNPENEGAIAGRSALAGLVKQTTMNDGSKDNIIDKSSCISVKLPVTVQANGSLVEVNSPEDYLKIERIFDELPDDVDTLIISFPITIILADFSEVVVNSEDELDDFREDCIEGGGDLDIECIDFIYPITISYYDSATQVVDVVSLGDDEELFDLIESLEDSEFVSIEFPITVIVADGNEMQINNNIELENVIEAYADQCDEDDDNDYSDDDIDDSALINILINGDWVVEEFRDEVDYTSYFLGYFFSFNVNGSAVAGLGESNINGSWNSYGDDGRLELELNFGSNFPLDKLEEEWAVYSLDDSTIYLMDETVEGYEEVLTFRRATENDTLNALSFSDIIVDGSWSISEYIESDTAKTEIFTNYVLNFDSDSTVMASNDVLNFDGTWLEIIDFETHELEFVFEELEPFIRLNENWDIINYTLSNMTLERESSEFDTKDKLVLEKVN